MQTVTQANPTGAIRAVQIGSADQAAVAGDHAFARIIDAMNKQVGRATAPVPHPLAPTATTIAASPAAVAMQDDPALSSADRPPNDHASDASYPWVAVDPVQPLPVKEARAGGDDSARPAAADQWHQVAVAQSSRPPAAPVPEPTTVQEAQSPIPAGPATPGTLASPGVASTIVSTLMEGGASPRLAQQDHLPPKPAEPDQENRAATSLPDAGTVVPAPDRRARVSAWYLPYPELATASQTHRSDPAFSAAGSPQPGPVPREPVTSSATEGKPSEIAKDSDQPFGPAARPRAAPETPAVAENTAEAMTPAAGLAAAVMQANSADPSHPQPGWSAQPNPAGRAGAESPDLHARVPAQGAALSGGALHSPSPAPDGDRGAGAAAAQPRASDRSGAGPPDHNPSEKAPSAAEPGQIGISDAARAAMGSADTAISTTAGVLTPLAQVQAASHPLSLMQTPAADPKAGAPRYADLLPVQTKDAVSPAIAAAAVRPAPAAAVAMVAPAGSAGSADGAAQSRSGAETTARAISSGALVGLPSSAQAIPPASSNSGPLRATVAMWSLSMTPVTSGASTALPQPALAVKPPHNAPSASGPAPAASWQGTPLSLPSQVAASSGIGTGDSIAAVGPVMPLWQPSATSPQTGSVLATQQTAAGGLPALSPTATSPKSATPAELSHHLPANLDRTAPLSATNRFQQDVTLSRLRVPLPTAGSPAADVGSGSNLSGQMLPEPRTSVATALAGVGQATPAKPSTSAGSPLAGAVPAVSHPSVASPLPMSAHGPTQAISPDGAAQPGRAMQPDSPPAPTPAGASADPSANATRSSPSLAVTYPPSLESSWHLRHTAPEPLAEARHQGAAATAPGPKLTAAPLAGTAVQASAPADLVMAYRHDAQGLISDPGAMPAGGHTVAGPAPPGSTAVASVAHSVAQQMIAQIALAPDNIIDVALNPEELGRLRFELHQHGDLVRVHLVAERPDTLELLRRHADELLAELRQAGFGGAELSFGAWGKGGSHPAAASALSDAGGQQPAPSWPEPAALSPQEAATGGGLHLRL